MSVVPEVQIVVPTIKIDPALHCGALRRTDGYRQRCRTVRRYRYTGRYGDRGIAAAQGSSVPLAWDRSAEGTRRKLCRGHVERLIGACRVA